MHVCTARTAGPAPIVTTSYSITSRSTASPSPDDDDDDDAAAAVESPRTHLRGWKDPCLRNRSIGS
jgi:hypothetical protein